MPEVEPRRVEHTVDEQVLDRIEAITDTLAAAIAGGSSPKPVSTAPKVEEPPATADTDDPVTLTPQEAFSPTINSYSTTITQTVGAKLLEASVYLAIVALAVSAAVYLSQLRDDSTLEVLSSWFDETQPGGGLLSIEEPRLYDLECLFPTKTTESPKSEDETKDADPESEGAEVRVEDDRYTCSEEDPRTRASSDAELDASTLTKVGCSGQLCMSIIGGVDAEEPKIVYFVPGGPPSDAETNAEELGGCAAVKSTALEKQPELVDEKTPTMAVDGRTLQPLDPEVGSC